MNGRALTKLTSRLGKEILVLVLLCATCCAARQEENASRLYQLTLNGTVAATLAPDGSRLAIIANESPARVREANAPWFNYLQIWDFRTHKLLVERTARIWGPVKPDDKRATVRGSFFATLAYSSDGRELVYCDGTDAHVFDAADYHELRTFPLTPATPKGPLWKVERISISPNGSRIAVTEIELDKDFWPRDGVVLNIYSLESGALEYTQEFKSVRTISGLAWSPDSDRLAITLSPDTDDLDSLLKFPDLRIVTPKAGTVETRAGYQQNWAHERLLTGDLAGDVAFVGDKLIATVAGGPALGPGRKDNLRVWDAETGKLLREIPSSPDGAHYHVRVSADGRVLLAYVGKDRRNENFVDAAQQRFRLWDTATWRVFFTSPPIPIPRVTNPNGTVHFELSSSGSIVMVWWPGGGTIYLYEWQQGYQAP